MRPTFATCCALGLAVPLIVACAERPVAVSPLFETQTRWETAAHWQDLAERAADGLIEAAARGGLVGHAFHVRATGTDTAFGQTFGALLTTALVERDAVVSPVPGRAAVVNVAARPIARPSRSLRTVPGLATAAGAAAYGAEFVADGWSWSSAPQAGALAGLTLFLDAARMSQPTSEVVVTISVLDGARYVYRLTESYYVRPANLRDYVSAEPPPVAFASGPAIADAPAPTRRLPVVGPPEGAP